MIKFPNHLTFSAVEIKESKIWAEGFNANSPEGAVYGKLCELALARELRGLGYNVELNPENNKSDLFWDLKVDDQKIDVKTTKANSFTISRHVYEKLNDGTNKLFVFYSFLESFNLVGVLTTDDVKRLAVPSKHNDGYYIMKYVVKANSNQSLS